MGLKTSLAPDFATSPDPQPYRGPDRRLKLKFIFEKNAPEVPGAQDYSARYSERESYLLDKLIGRNILIRYVVSTLYSFQEFYIRDK